MRLALVVACAGLVAGVAIFPQEQQVQPQVVPLQPAAQQQAAPAQQQGTAVAAAPDPAASPGPGVDWATGAPLPAAPTEVPPPATWTGDDRLDSVQNSNCVSVMPGTSDWWCATTCNNKEKDAAACPPTMCKCDEKAKKSAQQQAADALKTHQQAEAAVKAADPLSSYPDGLPDGAQAAAAASPSPTAEKPKCTAILDTATDEWCTTTCETSYCPPTACKCEEAAPAPKMRLDKEPAAEPAADPAAAATAAAQAAQTAAADAVASVAAASSPGPGVDWATGAELPQAPMAVPETATAPAPVPVPATPATEVAQPADPPPVSTWQGDDRIQNAADSSCVSIMPGTSDWWCATTCASRPGDSSACPPTMCRCDAGAKKTADERAADAIKSHQQAEAAVKDAAENAPGVQPVPSPVAVPAAVPQQQSAAAPAQQQAATAAPLKTEGEIADELAEHKQAEEAVKAAADAVKAAADLTKGAGASPSPEPASKCKAILDTATDEWCATTCATSYCPPTACKCDDA